MSNNVRSKQHGNSRWKLAVKGSRYNGRLIVPLPNGGKLKIKLEPRLAMSLWVFVKAHHADPLGDSDFDGWHTYEQMAADYAALKKSRIPDAGTMFRYLTEIKSLIGRALDRLSFRGERPVLFETDPLEGARIVNGVEIELSGEFSAPIDRAPSSATPDRRSVMQSTSSAAASKNLSA